MICATWVYWYPADLFIPCLQSEQFASYQGLVILMGKNRNTLFHVSSLWRFNTRKQQTIGQRGTALNRIPSFHKKCVFDYHFINAWPGAKIFCQCLQWSCILMVWLGIISRRAVPLWCINLLLDMAAGAVDNMYWRSSQTSYCFLIVFCVLGLSRVPNEWEKPWMLREIEGLHPQN